ncbi:DUF6529 family protein [Streptomyces sp. Marseille-Q5077]
MHVFQHSVLACFFFGALSAKMLLIRLARFHPPGSSALSE